MVQQPAGQVALVVLFESILFLQKPEQDHGFVQDLLHLGVRETLDALLQLVVDEETQVLGASCVDVQKVFKVSLDDLRIKKTICKKKSEIWKSENKLYLFKVWI